MAVHQEIHLPVESAVSLQYDPTEKKILWHIGEVVLSICDNQWDSFVSFIIEAHTLAPEWKAGGLFAWGETVREKGAAQ